MLYFCRVLGLLCLCLFLPECIAKAEQSLPPPQPASSILSDWLQRLQSLFAAESFQPYQPVFSLEAKHPVKEYIVGVHPLHNPKRLFDVYGPIVEYINSKIPRSAFKLEASRNYQEFEKKLYAGHFDFAMPNPYQTINALKHGYRVFGKMADDEDFRGIILVRKDSGINKVTDLAGKAVSYPAKTALAATMMPQYYLHTHGIDVNRDIENRYVGSQESSIINVLMGNVAAAATWPVPWKIFVAEHPAQAAELEVKWQTESLQNNSWMVRDDISPDLVEQFASILFSLQDSDAGRIMLKAVPVSRFEAANNQTYAPIEAFLNKFNQTVRPID